jgi:hypothetical protein
LRLRFFDLEAIIRSDSTSHIDLLDRLYGRFRADDLASPAPYWLDVALLTQPENPWRRPVLIVDQEVWPLRDPRLLEGWAYAFILSNIIARVRSHCLIHAGVVAWEGQGVLLPADSSYGKTTLVLELVRRGFRFLSDEMAALGWTDRCVHPFPRSLRIMPDTLARVGLGDRASSAPVWVDKLILDIEEIYPGSLGAAAAISHIVFLQEPTRTPEPIYTDSKPGLSISVDRADDDLLNAIGQIEGVEHASLTWVDAWPEIRVATPRRTAALVKVEELCRQRRTLILDVVSEPRSRPAFEMPAQLEQLSGSQAVMEMLRLFRVGLGPSLLREEFGFSAARLYWEVASLLTDATCYRLTVGPLEQMADLVCGLLPIDG